MQIVFYRFIIAQGIPKNNLPFIFPFRVWTAFPVLPDRNASGFDVRTTTGYINDIVVKKRRSMNRPPKC